MTESCAREKVFKPLHPIGAHGKGTGGQKAYT